MQREKCLSVISSHLLRLPRETATRFYPLGNCKLYAPSFSLFLFSNPPRSFSAKILFLKADTFFQSSSPSSSKFYRLKPRQEPKGLIVKLVDREDSNSEQQQNVTEQLFAIRMM